MIWWLTWAFWVHLHSIFTSFANDFQSFMNININLILKLNLVKVSITHAPIKELARCYLEIPTIVPLLQHHRSPRCWYLVHWKFEMAHLWSHYALLKQLLVHVLLQRVLVSRIHHWCFDRNWEEMTDVFVELGLLGRCGTKWWRSPNEFRPVFLSYLSF